MKKTALIILASSSIFIYNFAHSFMRTGYGDSTGAPLKKEVVTSRNSCASVGCHLGNDINSDLLQTKHSIQSNIPSSGWEAGKTYTITIKTESPSKDVFGFQFMAWGDKDSSSVGTFTVTNDEKTQITNSKLKNKFYQNVDTLYYVTHNGGESILANTFGENSWSFDWTAPTEKNQEVTFFTTFVIANGNGKTTQDYVYQLSSPASEQLLSVSKPTQDFQIYHVYPTYVQNEVNIDLGSFAKQNHQISILNTNGEKIISQNSDVNTELEITHLSQGTYIVLIQNLENNYTESIKIHKQ